MGSPLPQEVVRYLYAIYTQPPPRSPTLTAHRSHLTLHPHPHPHPHHSPLTTHHSTLTLTLTLTLQASRRLLPHRKQFFALAAELLLRLQPLQQLYVEGLLRELGQQPPEQAAAWLGLS